MEQRISVITLGVSDLEKSRCFYETGLSWQSANISSEEVIFFRTGGFYLALYNKQKLFKETKTMKPGRGFRGIVLSHNVSEQNHVDIVLEEALNAGGSLLKPPQLTNWGGYAGFFADPDDHPWEIVWNPKWQVQRDGSIIINP